jgi:D-serine deaminase-like pyridoxal phosphate-dependent protein
VLTSVIGVYPAQNKVIVDAGGLALSKDASAQRHGERIGYGLVLDVRGEPIPGAWVYACSQEHGQITAEAPLPLDRLKVGTKLRIQPNHICMTAAAHPGYHVINNGTEVEGWWPRVNGWDRAQAAKVQRGPQH